MIATCTNPSDFGIAVCVPNNTYAILGDIKDLDTKYLSTVGPVQQVSLEEIFGY